MLYLWFFACDWFDFYFSGIMGMRKSPQPQQGDVSSLHPFYEFPDDIPREILNNYTNKLGWLYNREFAISPTVDWSNLNKIGILERMNLYLTKTYVENGISFTCNEWKILFSIKEPIFKELCMEFFLTTSFEENTIDPHFAMPLVFRLGGQYRACSLASFAWRMGLHKQHEAMPPIFDRFLRLAARDYSQCVNGYTF